MRKLKRQDREKEVIPQHLKTTKKVTKDYQINRQPFDSYSTSKSNSKNG